MELFRLNDEHMRKIVGSWGDDEAVLKVVLDAFKEHISDIRGLEERKVYLMDRDEHVRVAAWIGFRLAEARTAAGFISAIQPSNQVAIAQSS